MTDQAGLKELSERAVRYAESGLTEETTKMALVAPFLRLLGWNPEHPEETRFEFGADWKTKGKDHADAALLLDGKPAALIECKAVQKALDAEDHAQLRKYFAVYPEARIGILTNGREWRFYSDLEHRHVMDEAPFAILDLAAPDGSVISMLEGLRRDAWNLDAVLADARRTKRLKSILAQIRAEAADPPDDLVKRYAACHEGLKKKAVLGELRPLVAEAFRLWAQETAGDPGAPAVSPEPAPHPPATPLQMPSPQIRLGFWTAFRAHAEGMPEMKAAFSFRKPHAQCFYDLAVGIGGVRVSLAFRIKKKEVQAALYFSGRRELFASFRAHEAEIAAALGEDVFWKEAAKDSRFFVRRSVNPESAASWPEAFSWLCDMSIRLKDAALKHGLITADEPELMVKSPASAPEEG